MTPIPHKSYQVLLADPPWMLEMRSDNGYTKSAARHYPTMPTPHIIALKDQLGLDWVCAPDSVLMMWCTWPMLARGDCHEVMRAWGFLPITGGAWHKITPRGKDTFGNGYMFRDSCEPFLVGTRGQPGSPAKGAKNIRNGFRAIRRDHSEKPIYLHRAIERMFPRGPWLELFARERRKCWDAWGLEVDGKLADYKPPGTPAGQPTPPILAYLGAP